MAYICLLNIKCTECPHHRYDDDRNRMACFKQVDDEAENKENTEEN